MYKIVAIVLAFVLIEAGIISYLERSRAIDAIGQAVKITASSTREAVEEPTSSKKSTVPLPSSAQVVLVNSFSAYDEVIFSDMNAVRTAPLLRSSDLADRAQKRVAYICQNKDFSHDAFHQFFEGSSFQWIGENLVRDFSDPQQAFDAFMGSPTHKANIQDPHYAYVGMADQCGVTVVLFAGFAQ